MLMGGERHPCGEKAVIARLFVRLVRIRVFGEHGVGEATGYPTDVDTVTEGFCGEVENVGFRVVEDHLWGLYRKWTIFTIRQEDFVKILVSHGDANYI